MLMNTVHAHGYCVWLSMRWSCVGNVAVREQLTNCSYPAYGQRVRVPSVVRELAARQVLPNPHMERMDSWVSHVVWDEEQPPWGDASPPKAPLVVDLNDEAVVLARDLGEYAWEAEGPPAPPASGSGTAAAVRANVRMAAQVVPHAHAWHAHDCAHDLSA